MKSGYERRLSQAEAPVCQTYTGSSVYPKAPTVALWYIHGPHIVMMY